MKFVDEIEIKVRAGHGGAGCVSFLHEKYREHGGPDGGDGGRGGNVFIQANPSIQALGHLMSRRDASAGDGIPGRASKKSGADGESLILQLPVGTQVYNKQSNELLCDLSHPQINHCVAKGGFGGRGNHHFATSTNQTPEYAQGGLPGEELILVLKLKLLADAGLVGLPNAGKSTLLNAITQKWAQVADYAFTTLTPNIGVVELEGLQSYRRLLLADIPGIIEGASKGVGLGLSFLRHIERVKLIVYMLDGSNLNAKEEILTLQNELRSYSLELLKRPALIVVNKMDELDYDHTFATDSLQEILQEKYWKDSIGVPTVCYISAKNTKGLDSFIETMFSFFQEETLAEISIQKEINSSDDEDTSTDSFVHITH